MRALIQRVTDASVTVIYRHSGETRAELVGAIGPGLVVLIGVTPTDSAKQAQTLAGKVANLRIFEDDEGKMNRSLLETGGSALVVSQFTLYADARKGRRPSFVDAARPEQAEPLIEEFMRGLRELKVPVATGRFRTEMRVRLTNDGPVTIWLDTAELGS